VVIVPVRDEADILPRFLSTTLLWADSVIIADQCSTDGSADVARQFPRVTVVENPSPVFSEDERQRILIEAARSLVPEPRVLVALDADEILSANALTSPEWRAAVAAAPGTSGRIARIELCERTSSYFRHAFDDAGTRWGVRVRR
jgi:hypothetical protein